MQFCDVPKINDLYLRIVCFVGQQKVFWFLFEIVGERK